MDIALIVGVVLGLGAIVGSMAIAFASGAAGSFANFIRLWTVSYTHLTLPTKA